jgi:hypothetical protein
MDPDQFYHNEDGDVCMTEEYLRDILEVKLEMTD